MNMSRVEIPTWVAIVGAIVLAIAYLFRRWQLGTNQAESQALKLARDTVDFWKDKGEALELAQRENAGRIKVLEADNRRLTEENRRLTDLVMGNEVPTALQEFMSQMHNDTMERIAAAETNMVKALGSMTRAFSDDLRETLRRTGQWDGETERRET